ncbi:MAG: NUDIX hydrolase [Proteobacteria bacterium]|nr:NUDIX hydrolase [Pseudomonadota bacterium]
MPYTYKYPRPMVTVDVVLFALDRKRVLLIKRDREPFKGRWALPGGFIGIKEELKDAAARELEEETGVVGVELKQVHAFDTLGRDPRGRVITVAYSGVVDPGSVEVRAASDAREARWFDIDNLPSLTFDHGEIVRKAFAGGFQG